MTKTTKQPKPQNETTFPTCIKAAVGLGVAGIEFILERHYAKAEKQLADFELKLTQHPVEAFEWQGMDALNASVMCVTVTRFRRGMDAVKRGDATIADVIASQERELIRLATRSPSSTSVMANLRVDAERLALANILDSFMGL